MEKFVISGPPCSGKSTLIRELSKIRISVVPEAALQLIEEERKNRGNIFPWTDFANFEERAMERQTLLENTTRSNLKFVVLDRGFIDMKTYYKSRGLPVPAKLQKLIANAGYTKAFLLDMLPEECWYKTESGKPRSHSYKEGMQLDELNRKVYEESGLPIIHVPVMPVAARVRMILKNLPRLD